ASPNAQPKIYLREGSKGHGHGRTIVNSIAYSDCFLDCFLAPATARCPSAPTRPRRRFSPQECTSAPPTRHATLVISTPSEIKSTLMMIPITRTGDGPPRLEPGTTANTSATRKGSCERYPASWVQAVARGQARLVPN